MRLLASGGFISHLKSGDPGTTVIRTESTQGKQNDNKDQRKGDISKEL